MLGPQLVGATEKEVGAQPSSVDSKMQRINPSSTPHDNAQVHWSASTLHVMRRLVTVTVLCMGLSPSECGDNLNAELAGSADELILEDGTYAGSTFSVSRNVTIRAQNTGKAILDGERKREVLTLDAGIIIVEGIDVTRGVAKYIYSLWDGLPSIQGIHSFGGVLIRSSVAEAKFLECNIHANEGTHGAGVHIESTPLPRKVLFLKCNIYDNTAWVGGGGVAIWQGEHAQNEFHACNIYSNNAHAQWWAESGGGVFIHGPTRAIFESCSIFHNSAKSQQQNFGYGGGLKLFGSFSQYETGCRTCRVELRTSAIYSNVAQHGANAHVTEPGSLCRFATPMTPDDALIFGACPRSHELWAPSPLCAASDQLCIVLEKLSQLQGYALQQSSYLTEQTALIEQQKAQLERLQQDVDIVKVDLARVNQTATELANSCAASSSPSQAPPPVVSSPPSQAPPPVATPCAGWCADSPKPASVKCSFAGCIGCEICVASPPMPSPLPAAGRCASWCASSPRPETVKCTFVGCSGCYFCGSGR